MANTYKMVVIGTSAGGIDALKLLFNYLKAEFKLPILVVQHLEPTSSSYLPRILSEAAARDCFEVEDKMMIETNCVYTPAPNYHMLFEKDWTISLTVDQRVSYARPSVDVLFETAADAVKDELIGIILTGANADGAKGIKRIQDLGGYTMVQEPRSAYASEMPRAALKCIKPNEVLDIKGIANKLNELVKS